MSDTNQLTLAPYYHPTTICFVDDNEQFLASLELELPGDWACRTFSDPEKAFDFAQSAVAVGDVRGAIDALERVLTLNPTLTNIKFELGLLYLRAGSPELDP